MLETAISLPQHAEFVPVMSYSGNNKIPTAPYHMEQIKMSTRIGNGTVDMAIQTVRNCPSVLSRCKFTHGGPGSSVRIEAD